MKSVFVTFLVFIVLSSTAFGMVVKPVNFTTPSPGGIFSFDFVVTSPPSQSSQGIQLTIGSVSGFSASDFNSTVSESVASNPNYWLPAGLPAAIVRGGSSYEFGDGPSNPPIEPVYIGDIVARFAFKWSGTPGNYTFNMNFNPANSFVMLENGSENISLPTGSWYTSPIVSATSTSFTVNLGVPEPVSILVFGLGGLTVLRKLRQ